MTHKSILFIPWHALPRFAPVAQTDDHQTIDGASNTRESSGTHEESEGNPHHNDAYIHRGHQEHDCCRPIEAVASHLPSIDEHIT